MSSITALADEYHRYRQERDHVRLLWTGDLGQLEKWEDLRPEAISERQRSLRAYADRVEVLDPVDEDDRILAETVAFTARSFANELTWRAELTHPNPAIGIVPRILTFLPRYRLITADHGERYHDKLRALPVMLDQAGDALRSGRDRGVVPLTRHLAGSIAAIDSHLAVPADRDSLVSQAPPTELSPAEAARWVATTGSLVADVVRPALARYRDSMTGVTESGRDDDAPGLCNIEGGADLYRDLVWSHTSLETTGEEVHRIGLEQVARLEREYVAVAGPLFGLDDVGSIYARLRDDPSLRYRDGAKIVEDATAALERARAAAPDWFGRLPSSPCLASEIGQGALAYYSRPDPSAGKPGTFFFNTSDPAAWGTFQLEAVTYHESIPGHHFQMALLVESDDVHPVAVDLPVAAHAEGWGLYTERLADEMGLYSSELDRLGMLAADSMRACRLVTDTGLHALGWSRDRAIEYVIEHSPLSRRIAEGEIDRYIGMPGQALSYMMGRLEIDRLRDEASSRPGFDIRDFHDRILGSGMVPLPTLASLVLD